MTNFMSFTWKNQTSEGKFVKFVKKRSENRLVICRPMMSKTKMGLPWTSGVLLPIMMEFINIRDL